MMMMIGDDDDDGNSVELLCFYTLYILSALSAVCCVMRTRGRQTSHRHVARLYVIS